MRQLLAGAVIVAVVGFVAVALARRLPALELVSARTPVAFPDRQVHLAWPAAGESAVDVEGAGMLASGRALQPVPIASVTKVMTAYLVLRDHPLSHAADGPQITVEPTDVEVYGHDSDDGQSVAAVREGESLSERQALEALLLPSANNIATLLARWDAGSEAGFVARMNSAAHALGLLHTHYADASGADPATVSTAPDQVRLAMSALRLPAFVQIVGLREATLPVAGLIRNRDELLGTHGISGVKTGSTSAAGACFVFSAEQDDFGRTITVVGAVLGQPLTPTLPSALDDAFRSATELLDSIPTALESFSLPRGSVVGWVKSRWASRVAIRTAGSVVFVGWPGLALKTRIVPARHLEPPLDDDQPVGTAVLSAGAQYARIGLVAARALHAASIGWRLSHP